MRKSHYTQIGKEMDWHPLEQGVFSDARKIKIAVIGIGREAGASFVAANLAYHLAKHVDGVTYMEAEDAQIAETLEGRRHACYSLGLSDTLGFVGAIEREGALKIDCAFAPEHRSNLVDPTGHEPPSESAGSLSFRRERECDRALGLERPTEHGRDRTHTADRNRESARPRDHDCQPASEWSTECSRLPEHDRPSDVFSMRGRRGKFTDYFALEKEGLPAGRRRNLYANVNWAVRVPLGAAPLEAASSETSSFSETRSETKRHAHFHTPRPAASEPCMLAATQGIGRIPGRYMIVDDPRPESLWEADVVICVVDPLPSRLRSGMQQLEALRDNQIRFGRRFSPLLNLPPPVLWLLNKDNPQAGHRELERSLNIKFDFVVPLIPSEIFYKAEYSSVPIFQMVEADARLYPSGCAACSEFGRLAKSVLKLLD